MRLRRKRASQRRIRRGVDDGRPLFAGRRRRSLQDGDDVEELRAALREHAREAERQRGETAAEIDALKQSLRRRIEQVAARERELEELAQRLERQEFGRGRRRRKSADVVEREAALERRARELDALAAELAQREQELARRERTSARQQEAG